MRKFFMLAAAAAVVALSSSKVSADPLYTFSMLASTSAGGTFTDTLEVQANTTYYFEIVTSAAAAGTHNSLGAGRTLNTAQGWNTFSLDVLDTSASPIAVTFADGALKSPFTLGIGGQPGTPAAGGITNIRGAANPGAFSFGDNGVVMTGTFTTGSSLGSGLTSMIDLAFHGTTSTFRINGSGSVAVNSVTEGSSDPLVGYNGLTLTTASMSPVPEPSSVVLLGLGSVVGLGALKLRRRRTA